MVHSSPFANGVKVMAFRVDHGPVEPAFGYRVDYRRRPVVISGDTIPSDNLEKFSQDVDLLVHEVGARLRNDAFAATASGGRASSRSDRGGTGVRSSEAHARR